MKIAKRELENKATRIMDNLLMWCGLNNAKKVAGMVKKNLIVEYKKRKELDAKQIEHRRKYVRGVLLRKKLDENKG